MSDQFFVELQGEFITEALFLLESYEEHMLGLESGENRDEALTQIFRVAHSIKGGASAVGFTDLAQLAHRAEDLLSILRVTPALVSPPIISILLRCGDEFKNRLHQLKEETPPAWNADQLLEQIQEQIQNCSQESRVEWTETPQVPESKVVAPRLQVVDPVESSAPCEHVETEVRQIEKKGHQQTNTSIKVDSHRVESVLDAVGEIVVLKNQLVHDSCVRGGQHPRLTEVVDLLDKCVRDLYEKALGIRMTPLKSLFLRVQRTVRDLSLQLEKPVHLEIRGEETEVERHVFEMLTDPLIHLTRNALDHGIEPATVRQERSKPATASVRVQARQVGGQVVIEIRDDGGGISREKVWCKALEKKLVPAEARPEDWTDAQVFQLLFAAGFSTAEKVTDLSGRGVGLDVVKSNLEKIRGKIEIESQSGVGSVFRLLIPLSTAITDGIVVRLGGQKYILPTFTIKEIVRGGDVGWTRIQGGSQVIRIRETLIPVIQWRAGSESSAADDPRTSVLLIIETTHGTFALAAQEVLGQTQAVVKPFQMQGHLPEISGAAVLGDGTTVLVLDPSALTSAPTQLREAA